MLAIRSTSSSMRRRVEASIRITLAVQRMVQAGCIPIAAGTYLKELQRDWSRTETAGKVREIYTKEGTAYGQAVRWELDLLKLGRYSIGSSFRGQVTLYNHLRVAFSSWMRPA